MSHTIVLMGPSGAGKSTVGQALAARFGVPHVDVDAEIERRTGQAVGQIFADQGEGHFRQLERDVTLELLGRPGIVSLGGGAPMTPAIREALAGHHVVWLQVSVGQILRRLGVGHGRPLLEGSNMRAVLIRMLAERAPVYESCASLVIDTNGLGVDEVVERVAEHVQASPEGVDLG